MPNLKDLTVVQLQRAIDIKLQIEKLQAKLDSIEGGESPSPATVKAPAPAKRKYHMTAAHKRKLIKTLARARAIRWAKIKGNGKAKADKPAKKKRKVSAAVRAKLAAIAKARWAKGEGRGEEAVVG